jgi:hypothetical protein
VQGGKSGRGRGRSAPAKAARKVGSGVVVPSPAGVGGGGGGAAAPALARAEPEDSAGPAGAGGPAGGVPARDGADRHSSAAEARKRRFFEPFKRLCEFHRESYNGWASLHCNGEPWTTKNGFHVSCADPRCEAYRKKLAESIDAPKAPLTVGQIDKIVAKFDYQVSGTGMEALTKDSASGQFDRREAKVCCVLYLSALQTLRLRRQSVD